LYYRGRRKALIVDDEPSICMVLKRTLESDGFEVATASTRQDAEARFRYERYDALILDLRMGDCRGDELFYFAIAHQPHLEKQTVFLTGDVTVGGWKLISATGCPMVLKPYVADELLKVIHSLLRRVGEASA